MKSRLIQFLVSIFVITTAHSALAEQAGAYLVEINRKYSCYLEQEEDGDVYSRLALVTAGESIEQISRFINFRSKIRRWRSKARTLRTLGNSTGFTRRRSWIKRAKQCRKQVGDYEYSSDAADVTQGMDDKPDVIDGVDGYQSPVTDEPCDVAGDTDVNRHLRILRGEKCEIGNSPVVQLLLYFNGERRASFTCTGTAIAGNVVLFAAHCVNRDITAIEVVPGGNRSNSVFAQSVIANSNFNFSVLPRGRGDIALAFLPEVLPTRTVKVLTRDNVKPGDKSIIAGYGLVDSNLYPGVASDDFDGLQAGYAIVEEVRSTEIMTRYDESNPNQSNTCSGDSGGPLFVKKGGEWVIAAVTSFGTSSNCDFGELSGYAKLSDPENIEFINRHAPGILE